MQVQIDALRDALPALAVTWVAAENVHLTLKFLGDVPLSKLDQVKEAAQKAAVGTVDFSLTAEGLGCFPTPRRPKVIWVGVNGEKNHLAALRDRIESHIAPLGYPTEDRPFSPHLTLGRVKATDGRTLGLIGDLVKRTQVGKIANWVCSGISVMQSTLKPTGAVYTPLAHFEWLSLKEGE